ncbi:UNVERIFIED_CONTAM: hypothetical protein PYX00_008339 [Menopon gallinae]|uniref:Ubiquitin-conjugating enzyme E2 Z n=1 Tax=Menopon gallinae TaxID=328185 RepID=A0AAW2HNW0_9NEOP
MAGHNAVPVNTAWDPFHHADNVPTPQCLLRIKRDINTLYEDPPPNIFVVPDEKDFTIIHALITGTFDTPYEGGFFYFLLRCPSTYPMRPPWVKFMTTAGGTVRMNPNLYKNGKVCLSILGTWPGPGWSPANTLWARCLMSIQSLLGEKPYHNEPGYDQERICGDSQRYNEVIQHETLRVAVCGMIENDFGINIPKSLVQVMEKTFLDFYDIYENIARRNLHLNNKLMLDPFGEKRGTFQYENILKRLIECKKKILSKLKNSVEVSNDDSSSSSSSSSSDLDDPPSESDSQSGAKNETFQ